MQGVYRDLECIAQKMSVSISNMSKEEVNMHLKIHFECNSNLFNLK